MDSSARFLPGKDRSYPPSAASPFGLFRLDFLTLRVVRCESSVVLVMICGGGGNGFRVLMCESLVVPDVYAPRTVVSAVGILLLHGCGGDGRTGEGRSGGSCEQESYNVVAAARQARGWPAKGDATAAAGRQAAAVCRRLDARGQRRGKQQGQNGGVTREGGGCEKENCSSAASRRLASQGRRNDSSWQASSSGASVTWRTGAATQQVAGWALQQ
ncbi:hypothetical protein ABZP36_018110 [Zizania latifolia]